MKAILQENTVVIKNVSRQHLRNKSFSLMQEAAKKSYHLTALIIIFFCGILCRLAVGSGAALYDIGKSCKSGNPAWSMASDLRCGFCFSF